MDFKHSPVLFRDEYGNGLHMVINSVSQKNELIRMVKVSLQEIYFYINLMYHSMKYGRWFKLHTLFILKLHFTNVSRNF